MKDYYKKRHECAICKGTDSLNTIIKYGEVPLAGDFPREEDFDSEEKFNMDLLFCDNCCLLQTDSIIDGEKLFKDYRYMSSIGLSNHFTQVAGYLKETFSLDENSHILEIGSNDGVLLKPLQDLGLNPIGVEPATNINNIATEKGCSSINDFFSVVTAKKHFEESSFDLAVSNNCFAHIDDIHSIVRGVKYVLKDGGHFVIEVHYVKNLIQQLQYDNIYHEHLYYYSLNSLKNLFDQHGMTIVDYQEIPIHSGSIRVTVCNQELEVNEKVKERLEHETEIGLTSIDFFKKFSDDVYAHIEAIRGELVKLKNDGYRVVGYGASGRANMLCNLGNITTDLVEYIVDESPERCGRYIAGKHIPIVSKEHLLEDKPDYIMIFAWNFSRMIIDKLEGNGFKYMIGFPTLQIVEKSSDIKNLVTI
jgi:SAM-dependent methyltransferase